VRTLEDQRAGVVAEGVTQTAHEDPYRWECRAGKASILVLMGCGLLADGWIEAGGPQHIVTDEPTWALHGERVTAALGASGADYSVVMVPRRGDSFESGALAAMLKREAAAIRDDATLVAFGGWWTCTVAASLARRAADRAGVPWVRIATSLGGMLSATAEPLAALRHPAIGDEPGGTRLHPPVVSYADPALLVPAMNPVGGLAALLQVAMAHDPDLFLALRKERSAIAHGWWTQSGVAGLLARALDKLVRDRWGDPFTAKPYPPSRVGSMLTDALAGRSGGLSLGCARSVDVAHSAALAAMQGLVPGVWVARVTRLMDHWGMPCTDPAVTRTLIHGTIRGLMFPTNHGRVVEGMPTTMGLVVEAAERLFGAEDGLIPDADPEDDSGGEPGHDLVADS
jgi:hypothetical protein